jgi:hypothetical protein
MLLLDIEEGKANALRTIGGAIFYTLNRYGQLMDMHRDMLCSYIGKTVNEPYCIEPTKNGFLYTTKDVLFEYVDHYLHEERQVFLRPTMH